MKKQILIIVALLVNSVLYSQMIDTNFNRTKTQQDKLKYTTIELEIDAVVDNHSISDSITVNLIYNGIRTSITGPNKFTIYLRYDIKYFVEITYKDYTAKLLQIDTRGAKKADWILTAHVNLTKTKYTSDYAGGFAYQDNTFKSFKN